MMSPDQILEHLHSKPFQPLRIYLSDGGTYEVRHPEMALVARRQVAIALSSQEGRIPERMVFCDPLHVTRIEPIESPSPK